MQKTSDFSEVFKWYGPGSNRRHMDFQSIALPTWMAHGSSKKLFCDVLRQTMRQSMFTEPKIVLKDNPSIRGYITYYFNGKRYREYNGKRLNLDLNPNQSTSLTDRNRLFKKLCSEFYKSLLKGWSPERIRTEIVDKISIRDAMKKILNEKLNSELSLSYKTDLSSVLDKFLLYLSPDVLNSDVSNLSTLDVSPFLFQFNSSATYYMNRRRALNIYFRELQRLKLIISNPIENCKRVKKVAKLHKVYDAEQLKKVLTYLETHYPNLHICCLLAYGCFLRPHQEIRLLKLSHLSPEYTKITLSGAENKSKVIRTVNIPSYVQEALIRRLQNVTDPNTNILSLTNKAYNLSYLNTQWSRAKKKMLDLGLLQTDQTIYSFRHSAAINVYKKTKDLYILQRMLQHSNMIVTLTYLRGLGELNNDDLKNSLPDL
jgi:integrase